MPFPDNDGAGSLSAWLQTVPGKFSACSEILFCCTRFVIMIKFGISFFSLLIAIHIARLEISIVQARLFEISWFTARLWRCTVNFCSYFCLQVLILLKYLSNINTSIKKINQ